MKRIIILGLLLLTGCTCNYEIELNSKSVNEKVKLDIQNDELSNYTKNTSMDDYIFYIFEDGVNPLINDESIVYERKIEDTSNGKEITLERKFNSDEFKKYSYFLNDCFEYVDFDYKNGNYKIKLSGHFYCFYDDKITINVKGDNISKANGLKNNDKYTWVIDSSNYNNVDIQIETSYENNIRQYIFIAIAIIFGIGLLLFIIYVVGNIMGRDSINSI